MAAVVGHYNFWNITSEQALQEAWLGLENVKPLSVTSAVLSILMSPIIVFGNVLVLLAVWKDPLKKLRSSPSNFILTSMAIADLLVGLAVCPITAYWGWVIYREDKSPFDLSVIFAINVFSVNVSFGHMFLLTVDRVFAVVTPLHYRVIVTNKRVLVANCICWMYFVAFGCAFLMLRDYFAIMGAVYNVQLLFILFSMLIMYIVIMFRFHRYSKKRVKDPQSSKHRRIILQRERNLFKAITVVISAFLICYMPWFIVQVLIYICRPCHPNLSLLMISFRFSGSLTYANSGLNPMLYAWRLPKYKETFKYFWKQIAAGLGRHREERTDSEPDVCNTKL
ncbi:adrenocorticotropic hormone receptor-like [Oculina patagonica]